MEERFMELPLESINEHYLIKFLLGMHRKKLYESVMFISLSEFIGNKIEQLSNGEFLNFLKVLNESDIDFESKNRINGVVEAINRVAKKLESRLYVLKLAEIAELLFLLVKFQIDNPSLADKCFLNLDNIVNVPKSAFIKTLFAFTIKDQYQKAIECVPIVEELTKYGPVGYFFSPYEFPLLAYCLFTLEVKGNNVKISEELLSQTEEALKQINPAILNDFVRKGYG
jgi:hypothetical protein